MSVAVLNSLTCWVRTVDMVTPQVPGVHEEGQGRNVCVCIHTDLCIDVQWEGCGKHGS